MDVYQPVGIGNDFLGYRIEELIGRGGMGVVYRAYDLRLKRPVALKLVAPALAGDERFRERFARETELVMSLEHPNVVPIHDAGNVDGRLYLAMRLVDGTDLGSLLRAEGALEPARAVAICAQIASALDAAHALGLVHRDVKPSNVLLDGSEHVYLADFGLTKSLGNPIGDAGEERSLGTPAYLAPEQLDGLEVDGRADVYSLACVLYECLTGERVFPRDSRLAEAWSHLEEEPPRASRIRRGLPERVDRVISRALAKEPAERYPTCGALVAAAERGLGLRRPARFRGRLAVAVVGIALAIAASLAVAVALRGGRGLAAPPRTHANTLVRIDPHTNRLQSVIDVTGRPRAVAAWGRTVWVYSQPAGVVSEVDAETNRVLHRTLTAVNPIEHLTAVGPALAADRSGAWIVGVDKRGPVLMLIPRGGGPRRFPLGGHPLAVATGNHAVWVLVHGRRNDRLLRFDPATSRKTVEHRFPLSSGVDTLTFGFRDLWLVGSRTAILYRVDPRSGSVRHSDLGQTAGRPVAMAGDVWVNLSDYGGFTMPVDPRTLSGVANYAGVIGPRGTVGADAVGAFGSVWTYDVPSGAVDRWHPPSQVADITVTHAPYFDGNCMTSMAATGSAIWVTLARPGNGRGAHACDLY
jgi:Protein kinase domain